MFYVSGMDRCVCNFIMLGYETLNNSTKKYVNNLFLYLRPKFPPPHDNTKQNTAYESVMKTSDKFSVI